MLATKLTRSSVLIDFVRDIELVAIVGTLELDVADVPVVLHVLLMMDKQQLMVEEGCAAAVVMVMDDKEMVVVTAAAVVAHIPFILLFASIKELAPLVEHTSVEHFPILPLLTLQCILILMLLHLL